LFQNAWAFVAKFVPFTTIVNGTLFVGAVFGVNEPIASGPAMAVLKVAFVAAGDPHASVNKVRQQMLREEFRNFMSQPVVSEYTCDTPKEHSPIGHRSQHASLEVAGY